MEAGHHDEEANAIQLEEDSPVLFSLLLKIVVYWNGMEAEGNSPDYLSVMFIFLDGSSWSDHLSSLQFTTGDCEMLMAWKLKGTLQIASLSSSYSCTPTESSSD